MANGNNLKKKLLSSKVNALFKSTFPGAIGGAVGGTSTGLPSRPRSIEDLAPGEGFASSITRAEGDTTKPARGGFTVLPKPLSQKEKIINKRPVFKSGLPTNRQPTDAELGGELGRVSKFVSELSAFNKARGLAPGRQRVKKGNAGLSLKEEADLISKELTNTINLDPKRRDELRKRLDAILAGSRQKISNTSAQNDASLQADLDLINSL